MPIVVLSEFTGASDELKSALLINPHDIDGLKDSIMRAVEMPRSERRKRMKTLRKRVRENDVNHWSEGFLRTLAEVRRQSGESDGRVGDDLGELEWTVERAARD